MARALQRVRRMWQVEMQIVDAKASDTTQPVCIRTMQEAGVCVAFGSYEYGVPAIVARQASKRIIGKPCCNITLRAMKPCALERKVKNANVLRLVMYGDWLQSCLLINRMK